MTRLARVRSGPSRGARYENSISRRLLAALTEPKSTLELSQAVGEPVRRLSGLMGSLADRGWIRRLATAGGAKGRPLIVWERVRDIDQEHALALANARTLLESAGYLVRPPRPVLPRWQPAHRGRGASA